jgi:hypothetical protein
MAKLLVIPNWERDFENSKSRQIVRTNFFCVPNHFDGKKIKRLGRKRNALELYGAFHAICAIASKCPTRGVLMDADGPINSEDLADKTVFDARSMQKAIEKLADPSIGLVELHEVAQKNGIWELPVSVRLWAVTRRRDAASADAERDAPTGDRSTNGNHPVIGDADTRRRGAALADAARPPPTESATHRPEKGTEQKEEKGTEPPTVPQGGHWSEEADSISNEAEAKRLICKLVLNGKDPARAWSYEAQTGLARNLPIPLKEIQLVGWFHRLADDDSIQELRTRRKSEGTLMQNWSDEVTRAAAYRKKMGVGLSSDSAKKEPPRWREFFEWKYRHAGPVRLPEKFDQLPADQRKEWEAGHEAFEREVVKA